jgi:hypothetical protein
MNRRSSYAEMLLDPRWQRKRLEILEAADWKCSQCGSGDKTLHVHHMHYERGKKPWEYENRALRSLCEDCHFSTQDLQADIARHIAMLDVADLPIVLGYVAAIAAVRAFIDGRKTVAIPLENADDIDYVLGIAAFFHVPAQDILDATTNGSVLVSDAFAK